MEESEESKRTKRSGRNTEQQETARIVTVLQLGIRNTTVNSSDLREAIKRLLGILVKNQDIEDIEQEASQKG